MKDICVECISMQMNLYSELSKDEKLAKAKELVVKYNSSLLLGNCFLKKHLKNFLKINLNKVVFDSIHAKLMKIDYSRN